MGKGVLGMSPLLRTADTWLKFCFVNGCYNPAL